MASLPSLTLMVTCCLFILLLPVSDLQGTIRHINSLHLDLKPQLHTHRHQHKVPASSGIPTSHLRLLHLGNWARTGYRNGWCAPSTPVCCMFKHSSICSSVFPYLIPPTGQKAGQSSRVTCSGYAASVELHSWLCSTQAATTAHRAKMSSFSPGRRPAFQQRKSSKWKRRNTHYLSDVFSLPFLRHCCQDRGGLSHFNFRQSWKTGIHFLRVKQL